MTKFKHQAENGVQPSKHKRKSKSNGRDQDGVYGVQPGEVGPDTRNGKFYKGHKSKASCIIFKMGIRPHDGSFEEFINFTQANLNREVHRCRVVI